MSHSFATLIPDAQTFLTQLAAQNSRDWFTQHKSRYDDALKAPALALLDTVAAGLERDHGPISTKLFRPQRDTRFAKDKTPYHTHLHLLWGIGGARPDAPGFFFGIDPEGVMLGAGQMGFPPKTLAAFRARIASDQGAGLPPLLARLHAQGFTPHPPELKRVPAPYGADHPRADLLRRKSLSLWRPLDPATPDLGTALTEAFATLSPLITWLRTP